MVLQIKSPDTAPDVIAEDTSIIKSMLLRDIWSRWIHRFRAGPIGKEHIDNLKAGVTGEDGKVYTSGPSGYTRNLTQANCFNKRDLEIPFEICKLGRGTRSSTYHKQKLPGADTANMIVGKANGEGVTMQTLEMLSMVRRTRCITTPARNGS